MRCYLYILILALVPFSTYSQICNMRVIDQETGNRIPYVVIRVIPNNNGDFLITDEKGELNISDSLFKDHDSIQFSSLGYLSTSLSWDNIQKHKGVIELTINPVVLNKVVVTGNMIELGNLAKKKLSGVILLSGDMVVLGIENIQKINGNISKIKYYQDNFSGKKLCLRLRLFKIDKQQPGFMGEELLNNEVIIIKPKKNKGWVEYDIRELNIPFYAEGIFVGLQMLPESYYNHRKTTFITPNKGKIKRLTVFLGGTQEKVPGDLAHIISEHKGKTYYADPGYPLIRIIVNKTPNHVSD